MALRHSDLVIQKTEVGEYELTVFPWKPIGLYESYCQALDSAIVEAHKRKVDVWLTEDLREFTRVAEYRMRTH